MYGSSPLARGLRRHLPGRAAPARIIPARAGFTSIRRSTTWTAPDHPRSRGVYGDPQNSRSPGTGSSPLARGLRLSEPVVPFNVGIIPARAGFTNGYKFPCILWGPGSSPLARGLLAARARLLPLTRIIPARAGFTMTRCPAGPAMRDHPRSRGVYRQRAAASL